MLDLHDSRGLICGFRLRPKTPMQPVELKDIACDELGREPLWLHFNVTDMRAKNWIESCTMIPRVARDLLLSSDRNVGFEPVHDGLVAIVGDLRVSADADPLGIDVLSIYVSANLVVTGRRRPLQGIDRLRCDAQQGLMAESPPQLVAMLLRRLADLLAGEIAALSKTVDDTEERLLSGGSSDGRELGRVRRYLARLRRHIAVPHDEEFDDQLQCWCNEEDYAQLRRACNRMSALAADLELVQVRARLVQEELTQQLGEATNRNLLFLSIVTSLMLPVTLISGIFGMNVGGLPLTENPSGFLWSMGLMGTTLLVSILVLRSRGLH